MKKENIKVVEKAKKKGLDIDNKTIKQHENHKLELVNYGDPVENIALECMDCNEVLADKDINTNDGVHYYDKPKSSKIKALQISPLMDDEIEASKSQFGENGRIAKVMDYIENIDKREAEFVSPNYVKDIADKLDIELSSSDVVFISDNYENLINIPSKIKALQISPEEAELIDMIKSVHIDNMGEEGYESQFGGGAIDTKDGGFVNISGEQDDQFVEVGDKSPQAEKIAEALISGVLDMTLEQLEKMVNKRKPKSSKIKADEDVTPMDLQDALTFLDNYDGDDEVNDPKVKEAVSLIERAQEEVKYWEETIPKGDFKNTDRLSKEVAQMRKILEENGYGVEGEVDADRANYFKRKVKGFSKWIYRRL